MNFVSKIDPDADLLRTLEAASPYTPFNTAAYAAALRLSGAIPCVLMLVSESEKPEGCLGLVTGRPRYRRLEIPSSPTLTMPTPFWREVREFCLRHDVVELQLNSFASKAPILPTFSYQLQSTKRTEFLLDLRRAELESHVSTNHKRNIKKAIAAGVEVLRSNRAIDCVNHVRLMRASMSRRIDRGEELDVQLEAGPLTALLETGAGELFQARLSGELLASVLVLRSRFCGYYQTAGTSPKGMSVGASPFLINAIANELLKDGLHTFNLGGAGPESGGLQRFKAGFGAKAIDLEARTFSLMPGYRRLARKAYAKLLKHFPIASRQNP